MIVERDRGGVVERVYRRIGYKGAADSGQVVIIQKFNALNGHQASLAIEIGGTAREGVGATVRKRRIARGTSHQQGRGRSVEDPLHTIGVLPDSAGTNRCNYPGS